MTEILWLIWSQDHGRWWGPGRTGYTPNITKAGRYPRRIADDILRESNFGGQVHEIAILAPESLDLVRATVFGLGWIEAKA